MKQTWNKWFFTCAVFLFDLNSFFAVLHLYVFWYGLIGMGAQKKAMEVLVTLFPYIFHVKTEWNIVYEYLKTKIFSRDTNILPQMHWTSNIFGHSATTIGGFWASLNSPILNFKKMVTPKNVALFCCFFMSCSVSFSFFFFFDLQNTLVIFMHHFHK